MLGVESSIITIDSNITNSVIRKANNELQEKSMNKNVETELENIDLS